MIIRLFSVNHKFFLFVLIVTIFTSCVYFNTFYNAETAYRQALKIIEESPITASEKLPSQADKLLVQAIENSALVLEDYANSKYIDDAIFIIGKSSFLRNEIAISEKHFRMIIDFYPESKYYDLAEIWLAYTHFRMGMIDLVLTELDSIQNKKLNRQQLFLINNLLAEISIEEDSLENVYNYYELAAKYASSNSKKTSIYGKLVKIAEKKNNKLRASDYLEELVKVAPDKIRIDSKMQWLTYQRELGQYDKIINEIGSLLGLSEFQAEYIKLELELGKIYIDKEEFNIAKDILLQLVEVYSKKEETSEAYYHLANISLIEDFNIDLAKEYFEKSKSEKSQSKYGRKSKILLNKISLFENLEDLYKQLIKNKESDYKSANLDNNNDDVDLDSLRLEEINFEDQSFSQQERYNNLLSNSRANNMRSMRSDSSNKLDSESFNIDEKDLISSNPDSVLFMISEILLYDFNQVNRSLNKLKVLVDNYPQTKFTEKALYVLSYYEPDNIWFSKLKTDFPNSLLLINSDIVDSTFLINDMDLKRDYAWSLANKSYDDAYNEFIKISIEENDTLSSYIAGYISDVYLHDIERAIKNYELFILNYSESIYSEIVDLRLDEIKLNLEETKEFALQAINYQNIIIFFHNEMNYDSVKILLNGISSGISSKYKNAASNLKSSINQYEKFYSIDSSINNKDSIFFNIALIFENQFQFIDSAKYYYESIINNFENSKYRYNSLISLVKLNSDKYWQNILYKEYPDSIFNLDFEFIPNIYHPDYFHSTFKDEMNSYILDYDKYIKYFKEEVDSSGLNSSFNLMQNDSLIILDTLKVD